MGASLQRGALAGLVLAAALAPRWAFGDEGGELRGLVFDLASGLPVAGVDVRAGDAAATTDEDGAFSLSLPEGAHVLRMGGAGYPEFATDPVAVVRGEVTEVIVDLDREGSGTTVDAEAPGPRARPSVEPDADLPLAPIEGVVRHAEDGTPVPGFRVFVRGLAVEARTGEDGRFRLEVPVGVHDLVAVHAEFATISEAGVEVAEGQTAELELEAVPVGVQLDDFVVTAPRLEGGTAALLQERQESGAVSDIIGAEQMSKSGDSDAAAAVKRVTGVTVVGGKYVYVRGLGERYSSTLLNGSTLPSPEPERRVVPLDLFPAGVLDSVVIQKTYTPDMPGEFGGGAVMLRTRGYPEDLVLDLSADVGMTCGTTFTEGLMSEGGSLDWLGIDDGGRQLPDEVRRASEDQALLEGDMFSDLGYTSEELEHFGESLSANWRTYRDTVPMDGGASLTIGDTADLGRGKLGFLLSGMYSNDWERRESQLKILKGGAGGVPTVQHHYEFDETVNVVKLGGILTAGAELGEDNRILSTTLVDRITDDTARYYWGYNDDIKAGMRNWRIRWIERMLIAEQIRGEHVIEPLLGLGVDWRYTYSRASRDEPDRREVTYYQEGDEDIWVASNRPDGNQRLFSHLLDNNHDLGLDLSMPFEQWTGEEARAKVGVSIVLKDRASDTRRFRYRDPPSDIGFSTLPPDELFTPEYIGRRDEYGWTSLLFEETTRETDNYSAEQEIYGGYGMVDFPLGLGLRLVGGLRIEKSRQYVRTFQLFNPDAVPVIADLETFDYLPGATLSWEFYENMVVRAGVSRTVSRPDFRELSPASYTNVIGGRDVTGNPDLDRALITNVDLRWEWYPGPGETISFGGFYKQFEKPIETKIITGAQHSESFANAKGAHNFGLELDLRKSFDWISEVLRDLYAAVNAAWIYSRVELAEEGGQTSDERPLQGQSPFVINAQLGYDNTDWGTSAAILYNVFGERISTVGAVGLPDVYEQPFHQLDIVAKQSLGAGFALGFKAKNLIDGEVRFVQGSETVESYRKGRSFQISLSYSY